MRIANAPNGLFAQFLKQWATTFQKENQTNALPIILKIRARIIR